MAGLAKLFSSKECEQFLFTSTDHSCKYVNCEFWFQAVQKALDKAKVGRTVITIAHRLSTIQDADVICVINEGKIVEQGAHQELLELRGLYYRLQQLQ